jgi:hypothetical protein
MLLRAEVLADDACDGDDVDGIALEGTPAEPAGALWPHSSQYPSAA